MSPESKPIIGSLAEMTCENCVYSIKGEEVYVNPGQTDEYIVNRSDCYLDNYDMTVRTSRDFCSKGKWVIYDSQDLELQNESETHPTSYDNCYYLFGRNNESQ